MLIQQLHYKTVIKIVGQQLIQIKTLQGCYTKKLWFLFGYKYTKAQIHSKLNIKAKLVNKIQVKVQLN